MTPAISTQTRKNRLLRLHIAVSGGSLGIMAYRAVEYFSGRYSLVEQLACIVFGIAVGAWAAKRFVKG